MNDSAHFKKALRSNYLRPFSSIALFSHYFREPGRGSLCMHRIHTGMYHPLWLAVGRVVPQPGGAAHPVGAQDGGQPVQQRLREAYQVRNEDHHRQALAGLSCRGNCKALAMHEMHGGACPAVPDRTRQQQKKGGEVIQQARLLCPACCKQDFQMFLALYVKGGAGDCRAFIAVAVAVCGCVLSCQNLSCFTTVRAPSPARASCSG